MQNYMLERFLIRISKSKYRNSFILKGGFLISTIIGIQARTTMDIDTTIKGFDLNFTNIKNIFNEICSIKSDDNITFELTKISNIRETDEYPGIKVNLNANYPPISVPITVISQQAM